MRLTSWSVRNRVATNLLAIGLLLAGIFTAAVRLQRDLFPDVSTNFIQITTIDPTTGNPADIEQLITIPIEEEVANIDGLVSLASFSQDNLSSIFLEIDESITNMDPIVNQVRQQVGIARARLPASVEEPVVREFDIPFPLVTFGVMLPAGVSVEELRPQLRAIERGLRVIPGVSDVLVDGLQDAELRVLLDPFLLEGKGLSLASVTASIQRRSQNWVGGRMEGPGGERVIRLQGEVTAAEDLADQPVLRVGEQIVRLRDLGTVRLDSEKARTEGRVNLREAVTFTIVKRSGADALDTAARARQAFRELASLLPEGIDAIIVTDNTKFIDVRIQTVLQNGYQALLIVTLLLVVLLNWRLAVLVAIGLPISFAGSFLVLDWLGQSINLLSLFALIMGLGIIVDDALVIAENVYRHYEEGKSPFQAAIEGTAQVAWPVIGSVSTTVAAFLPLMLGSGILGKFLLVIPVVVVSGLVFSLIQAFVILPSHLADFMRHPRSVRSMEEERRDTRTTWKRKIFLSLGIYYTELRLGVDQFLQSTISVYLFLLNQSLRRRYWVISGFIGLFFLSLALVASGVLRFQLFAADFADQIIVKMEFPTSYSLDQTARIVEEVERTIAAEMPAGEILGLITRIGGQLDASDQFLLFGSHLAMITVDIDDGMENARKPSLIERDLEAILSRRPELVGYSAAALGGGPPVGRAVNVRLEGQSFAELGEMAAAIEEQLREIPGLRNIIIDLERGKPEVQVRVDPERAALYGLEVAEVGQFLQGAYTGLVAARHRWDNEEVAIRVQFSESFQRDPELLHSYRIVTREGLAVPLEAIAEFSEESGLIRINRRNQQRLVTISADVEDRIITSRQANASIQEWMPELQARWPAIRVSFAGESEDTERSLTSMKHAAMLAFLLIYVILAVIFNSFLQPFIVMAVIPFGIVGVIFGLLVMGEPLGLMAIMGTIALSGIVVNNSVLFVDFMNKHRRGLIRNSEQPGEGDIQTTADTMASSSYRRWHAILSTGAMRFRPIILTTLTTIGGLLNLAFVSTGQEQFLAPMAQAIIFGLIFATTITLILIPSLYAILDDVRSWSRRRHNLRPASSSGITD